MLLRRQKKFRLAVFGLAGAALIASPLSHAAGVGLWGLGLSFGMALPNTSSQTIGWGLGVTRRFSPLFGIEGSVFRYGAGVNLQSETVNVRSDTSVTFWGVKPTYYFPGGPGLWQFGVKLGRASSAITSTTVSSTAGTITIDDSHGNWFAAPLVTFDYPVGVISVGAEAGYYLGLGDFPPKGFVIVGTAKYWF